MYIYFFLAKIALAKYFAYAEKQELVQKVIFLINFRNAKKLKSDHFLSCNNRHDRRISQTVRPFFSILSEYANEKNCVHQVLLF